MDTSAIVATLKSVTASHASLAEPERLQLLGACITFIESCQPLEKKLMDLFFAPLKTTVIRIAIDMGIFDVVIHANAKSGIPLQSLSDSTECEPLLIKRIMRVLVSEKLFVELDQDVFTPTPAAAAYSSKSPMAQIIIHMTTHQQSIIKLPEYFSQKGYKSPIDSLDCPFQYAMGTSLHNFDWIAAHPAAQHAFNVMMTIRTQRSIGEQWFKLYPIEQLITSTQPSDVFLVDIGAGIGHLTIELKKAIPEVSRMIVQDIEPVVKSIKQLPDGIEAMVADFFKPQPIRGAKVYFIAHCLHDWPDREAKLILGHLRDAMTLDSVLLLNETVMPERDVPFMAAAADLTMMAAFASLERTEKQFRELLDDVGLELVEVWSEEKGSGSMLGSSVVEARLKRVK